MSDISIQTGMKALNVELYKKQNDLQIADADVRNRQDDLHRAESRRDQLVAEVAGLENAIDALEEHVLSGKAALA